MSARTLFASSLRSTSLLRPHPSTRRHLSASCPRRLAPPAPRDPEDAHGSAPSRKLRPRDRLQFTEASEREQAKDGTSPAATSAATPEPSSTSDPATLIPPSSSFASSAASPSPSSSTPPPPPPDTGELVVSPPVSGLPPLSSHLLPIPRVPFSTHRFVRRLEDAGIEHEMAVELMKATKGLLVREEERAREELLSKQDLENEAYLFTAALNELKTGSQVKSRNDSITLKSLTAGLQREADALEQKMKEDMQRLGSDIQLEMNTRKEETGTELQGLDKKVMERRLDLNSKFTILLSEVRTEIEATKWISTRRVMTAIVILVVSIVAYFSSRSASSKKKASSSSSSSSNPDAPSVPSIEELGVRLNPADAEAELPEGAPAQRGWAYWTGQLGPASGMGVAQGKRVGEEGEGEAAAEGAGRLVG
ncbi:hypothetical protein JCM10207_008219 [Rhodosporidiobolus poonsookiae]